MTEGTDRIPYWQDVARRRDDVITIPIVWIFLLLSLLVHLAALWEFLPRIRALTPGIGEPNQSAERLEVRIANAPALTPSPTPAPGPRIVPPTPAPKVARPAPQRPPDAAAPSAAMPPAVLAAPPTAPSVAALPPSAPPAAQTAPPVEGDLASFIAARRRARGDPEPSGSTGSAPAAESDIARRDRIVAANLASINTPTFGTDPRNGGGIFQLRRVGYEDAEFTFFGWSKEIKRRAPQRIEVRKGNNSDIQIAVVRSMIAIIRDLEHEDFNWESKRLGRVVVLSAREKDTPGLEDFLMQEFFETVRAGR